MYKKLNISFTKQAWGISYSKGEFSSLSAIKKGDRYIFSLKSNLNGFDSVKQIYNENSFSYFTPYIPSEALSGERVHLSEIILPFTRLSDVNEAWREYLPTVCLKKGEDHKKVIASRKKGETKLHIFSFSKGCQKEYCSKQVPLPICMLGLTPLFEIEESEPLLILHLENGIIYSTLLKERSILDFSFSPHLPSIKAQLNALSLHLKIQSPFLFLSGMWGKEERIFILEIFPSKIEPLLKSSAGVSLEELSINAPLFGATLSHFLSKYQNALKVRPCTHLSQFKRPILLLYIAAILCFTMLLFAGYKEYSGNQHDVSKTLKRLGKDAPQIFSNLDIKEGSNQLIAELRKALNSTKKLKIPFALVPPTPDLSELFAWLQTYPSEHLHIKNISYKLTELPSTKTPHRKYSAKVNIEVCSTSPNLADNFQKELINESGFVNKNKPFSWRASTHHYLISFYLSDSKGL